MVSQNARKRALIETVDQWIADDISRRDFVRRMSALGGGAVFGGALANHLRGRSAAASPSGVPAVQDDPPPAAGGTIVAATIDKPVNMDPAFAELYSSMQVYQNVFNKLVYVDAEYNYIPGLATSWNQVDDVTWDFTLVENAVFHNDEPFTANDVAFTVERIFDPKLAAPNAVFLQAIDRVETNGDYNVRFILNQPWGSFLADLAAVLEIVNETAVTTLDPRLEPIGTGPFRMTDWVRDDHITLERWDKYHVPERPYLDSVIFRAVADDTVRLTGLQTNEMQWVMQVPLQQVEELKNAENNEIKVTVGRPYLPDFIYLNCAKPPFDDKRVRQALAWALNRDQVVQVAFFGQAVPATEAIYEGNPYYSGVNLYEGGPDPERARALLAEAGVEGLSFDFDGQPQVPTQVRTAQVLQQQLQQAGITMNIQNYESGDWITRLLRGEFTATISYWSATLDPAHFYLPSLLSDSGWNSTGFASEELDEAMNTFATKTDEAARKEAYARVVEIVQDEAPIIAIDNQLQQYWVRENVYGMTPLPTMEIRFEPVYIAE